MEERKTISLVFLKLEFWKKITNLKNGQIDIKKCLKMDPNVEKKLPRFPSKLGIESRDQLFFATYTRKHETKY